MLLSFALVSRDLGWCTPDIVMEPVLDVVGGKSPLHFDVEEWQPNDLRVGGAAPSCAIVTGPNGSGKSTLLRSTAQIVFLAHLGSDVPAARASIGICDAILSHHDAESLSESSGSFRGDMQQVSVICGRATSRSLIVLVRSPLSFHAGQR